MSWLRMREQRSWRYWGLGVGGFALSGIGLAMHRWATSDSLSDTEWVHVTAASVGILMLAWMVVITMHHRREHRHGPGRGLLIGAWALTGWLHIFFVQRAADTAAIDEGFVVCGRLLARGRRQP